MEHNFLFDLLMNGTLYDAIIALLIWRLFFRMNGEPRNQNLNLELKKLRVETDTAITELWDYAENTLTPIKKRFEMRERRTRGKAKDLKEVETKKKSGLMTPEEYKQYGID